MNKYKFSTILLGSLSIIALVGCDNKIHKSADVAAISSSSTVGIHYSTVRSEGVGKTFDEALQAALLTAIEQVNGVRASKAVNTQSLVGDYHSQESSSEKYDVSQNDNVHAKADVNGRMSDSEGSKSLHASEDVKAEGSAHASGGGAESHSDGGSFDSSLALVNASSATSGVVRRFQVASKSQSQGLWHVTIVAEIPVYQASEASKRLKIAVLPFRLAAGGKSADNFEESLRSEVVEALSQSGKVAVLDRDYSQENQDEISQLQSEDFSKDEAGKIGNRLGADYIIVGTVSRASASRDSVYMADVGQRVFGASHASAQLHFRLIESATGVVQTSGTLDSSKYNSNSLDNVAKAESSDLANRILESLYPLRVESISDGVFYLGKGGDSIHVGDVFRILRQGSPIVDSDTHETIGFSEVELGRIQVTEVEAKLSKARLVDGNAGQIGDAHGLIARRAEASAEKPSSTAVGGPGQKASVRQTKKVTHAASGSTAKEGVDF